MSDRREELSVSRMHNIENDKFIQMTKMRNIFELMCIGSTPVHWVAGSAMCPARTTHGHPQYATAGETTEL